MKLLKVSSPAVRRILANPAFLKRIAQPVKIVTKFDVPYLAGYSKNGKTIYVDKDVKTKWRYRGKIIDVSDFLVVHEVVEKAIIVILKEPYQRAHHIAEYVEALACRQHGVNWWAYSKYLKPQIKNAYHQKIQFLPPDLDIEPYEDEHEQQILIQLQKSRGRNKNEIIKETLTNPSDKFNVAFQKDNIVWHH